MLTTAWAAQDRRGNNVSSCCFSHNEQNHRHRADGARNQTEALSRRPLPKYPSQNETHRARIGNRADDDTQHEGETPILARHSRQEGLKRLIRQLRPSWRANHKEMNDREQQKLCKKNCASPNEPLFSGDAHTWPNVAGLGWLRLSN